MMNTSKGAQPPTRKIARAVFTVLFMCSLYWLCNDLCSQPALERMRGGECGSERMIAFECRHCGKIGMCDR